MDDKPERSEDTTKSDPKKPEDEEIASEPSSPLPEKSPEADTSKARRKILEKTYEYFQVPDDLRRPSKRNSAPENQVFKTRAPKMLQKPSRSAKIEPISENEPSDDETVPEKKTKKKGSILKKLKSALKTPDSSKEDTAGRKRKRKHSFVSFFTQRPFQEEPQKPRPRPSFVKRKLVALEKELARENIDKDVDRIHRPGQLDKQVDEETGEEKIQEIRATPLSSAMACIFLISATTGSAIASLPFFLEISSWFGVFFNLLLGFNALFAGLCTGWCWAIMERRWPEYLEYTRVPYQDIAYRALGIWMKYIVAICVDVSLLGTCASYILLIAIDLENIGNLYSENFGFCHTVIVFSILLTPFIMPSTYRNIKFIGVLDVAFSLLFTFLLVVSFFLNKPFVGGVEYKDPSIKSVAMSFAGFSFAYGTGAVLPSIMADMMDRNSFSQTCATAYMICIVIYTILPIMGYAAFGDLTPRYIVYLLLSSKYYDLAVVISFVHIFQLATTYVVAILPSLHAFEERVNCPDRFGLCRFIVRICIATFLLLLILGIPYLSKFVDLVGATTINLCTYIFPPLFYVCLIYNKESKSKNRKLSKKEWFLVAEIIVVGIAAGAVATYFSVENYIDSDPNRISCYLNMSAPLPNNTVDG